MLLKFGISLVIIGIIMFIYGISLFSFRGDLSFILKNLGEYSIVLWLPVLIIGTILTIIARIIKK